MQTYQCSICGKTDTNMDIMEAHEEQCKISFKIKQNLKKQYKEDIQERDKEAVELAKNSACLKVLIDHGHISAARIIVKHLSRHLFDCGTSSGWETLYDKMIEQVKR